MPPNLSPKNLVAFAAETLRQKHQGRRINQRLLDWLETVHEGGIESASQRLPKHTGEFGDWNVIQALEVISGDTERWKTPSDKIEVVMKILIGELAKRDIRSISGQQS